MEKRVVLLVVLCVAVFVGWSLLMQAIYPTKPLPPAPPPAPAPKDPVTAPVPKDPAPPPIDVLQEDVPETTTVFSNDKVVLTLTNKGAGIKTAAVKVEGQPDMPLLKLFPADPAVPHLAVSLFGSPDDTARLGWKVKDPEPDPDPEPGQSITYVFKLRNGLVLEKKLTLKQGRNEVKMLLTLANKGPAKTIDARLRVVALTGLEHDSPYRYDYYGHGFVTTETTGAHSTTNVAYDAPQPIGDVPNAPRLYAFEVPVEERATRRIEWLGLRNRYAAAILQSKVDRTLIERVYFRATTQDGPPGHAHLKSLGVEAWLREIQVGDRPHLAHFSLVLAPIRREELAAVDGGADFLLSYGCWGLFNPIGRLILWLVNVAHQVTGNYGWAIILTTLLVRVCMFPLSRKSQVSMARMAQLQPKLNLLRERYPDDQAKQQQETMKLFKEHGVNPLSGCFPILLQLPIFIGLYSVLDISLEFRQAPFIGWITDLSQPDRLIAFKQPLNLFITSVSDFNLLPIVMTITWFLQSYYAPKPQDPKMAAQQKMMMFMPVLFGLLCYSLASGLSLYLFINSLLAMIEQKIIKKYFLPAGAGAGPPGPPSKV